MANDSIARGDPFAEIDVHRACEAARDQGRVLPEHEIPARVAELQQRDHADYQTAVRASQDRVEALHRRALNAVTTVITGQRADIAAQGGAHMVVQLVERAVHLAVDEVLLAVSEPDTPAVPPLQTLITDARRLERELDQTVNAGHDVAGSLLDRLLRVTYWSLSYARSSSPRERQHCLTAADELAPLVEVPAVDRVPAYQLRLIRRALAVAALVRSVEPVATPIATSQERTM